MPVLHIVAEKLKTDAEGGSGNTNRAKHSSIIAWADWGDGDGDGRRAVWLGLRARYREWIAFLAKMENVVPRKDLIDRIKGPRS